MSEHIQLDLFENSFQNGNNSTKKKRQKKIKPEDEPLEKKIERALWLLRTAAADSDQPIEVSYSGGKDSDVILELARMAGIKYRAIYKNTTIDPPGTIKHCMENGVEVMRRKSFAQVIQAKGFPNFLRRFCCAELKEYKALTAPCKASDALNRPSEPSGTKSRRCADSTAQRNSTSKCSCPFCIGLTQTWPSSSVSAASSAIRCTTTRTAISAPSVGSVAWAVRRSQTEGWQTSRRIPVW